MVVMRHRQQYWAAAVGVVLLALTGTGCSALEDNAHASAHVDPATLVAVKGLEGISRITLTKQGAERVGIVTAKIATSTVPGATASMPYSALLYAADGHTWTYTQVSPLTYQRQEVTVVSIANNVVELKAGPPVGTPVVSVGAIELYGAETGVDE
jgi:hypothetical protein